MFLRPDKARVLFIENQKINNHVPIDRIQYREMAEQSIAKTFRGILRVANVVDCTIQDDDKIFNPTYYGLPKGGISDEDKGYNTAYPALTGGTTRYLYPEDPYKNNKVPVTDSLGNYLNFNVSGDGVTFGSDEFNNGNTSETVTFTQKLNNIQFTHEKIFPVLKSKTVIIGYEKRVLAEEKEYITGGSINIDPSPYVDSVEPMVIINNNYDHSPNHLSQDKKTYLPLDTADPNRKYRTIYRIRNDEVTAYDALAHYQDDIDWNNLNTFKTHDSFVDALDLKAYVKEKINQYLGNNLVEVPSGMVIQQYISLRKWYGIGETGTGTWAGNEPPMGKTQDTDVYTPTLYQGVVRKGINRLVAMSHEQPSENDMNTPEIEGGNAYGPRQLKELIPLYKRDYAICNGDVFTIYMMLPELSSQYDYPSYDRFINLFFAIGYQYTKPANIRPHYKNEIVRQDDGNVYHIKGYDAYNPENLPRSLGLIQSTDCNDLDVLFAVDMVTMMAIKVIYNELKNGTSNNGKSACIDPNTMMYSRSNAEKWLKNQPFPREFIFNSTGVPESEGGLKYIYKQPNYTKDTVADIPNYSFNLGSEINSFNSKIYYYDHTNKKYVTCKVWQTGEVQMVLDLFTWVNMYRERDLKNYFSYSFQIPNMDQHVDGKYDTGMFVGSSPFVWAEENKFMTDIPTISHHTSNTYPHRHVIFYGPQTFKFDPREGEDDEKAAMQNTGAANSGGYVRATGIVRDISNESGTPQRGRRPLHPLRLTANIDSYDIAEMKNVEYRTQAYEGAATYVIQWKGHTDPKHPDPRWRNAEPNRGLTSEPISQKGVNEKFQSASANSGGTGQIEWFNPENIKMVFLIKL